MGVKAKGGEGSRKPMTHDWEVICKCTSPFTWLYLENVNLTNVRERLGFSAWGHKEPFAFLVSA